MPGYAPASAELVIQFQFCTAPGFRPSQIASHWLACSNLSSFKCLLTATTQITARMLTAVEMHQRVWPKHPGCYSRQRSVKRDSLPIPG